MAKPSNKLSNTQRLLKLKPGVRPLLKKLHSLPKPLKALAISAAKSAMLSKRLERRLTRSKASLAGARPSMKGPTAPPDSTQPNSPPAPSNEPTEPESQEL